MKPCHENPRRILESDKKHPLNRLGWKQVVTFLEKSFSKDLDAGFVIEAAKGHGVNPSKERGLHGFPEEIHASVKEGVVSRLEKIV